MTCTRPLHTAPPFVLGESKLTPALEKRAYTHIQGSAMNTMQQLIKKYPNGYDGWEEEYAISREGENNDQTATERESKI